MKCFQDFSSGPRTQCCVVLRWDNSFSLLTQKCVHYKVQLFEKEAEGAGDTAAAATEGAEETPPTTVEDTPSANDISAESANANEGDGDDEELDLMAKLDKLDASRGRGGESSGAGDGGGGVGDDTEKIDEMSSALDKMLAGDGESGGSGGEASGRTEETIFAGTAGGGDADSGLRKR